MVEIDRILVPTDFSEAAQNAYQFAQFVGQQLKADLKLVHAYHPSFDPHQPPIGMEGNIEKLKNEQLATFTKKFKLPEFNNKVINEVVVGFTVDEIIHKTDQEDCDMVIMGSVGNHDLGDKIFGSISSTISRKAFCPVLIVPEENRFKGFDNIVYASDFEAADGRMVNNLVSFANAFSANVHFVHVDDQEGDLKELEARLFEELFDDEHPVPPFEIVTINGQNVVKHLSEYAEKNKIDLIVMVTKHRNIWESLMHKSTTRKMALETHVPLMIMHLEDK